MANPEVLNFELKNSISEECSAFMNPTDVFSPCTNNCIDIRRSGAKKNLTQPRLMQKELTKFDNTLKDMYAHLMKTLEETKSELKKELELEKIHPKRIKDILDDKFGAITTVPDASEKSESKVKLNYVKLMGESLSPETQKVQNKRNKEAEKKRRQKLQNTLIKKVVDDKGRLVSKYDELFTLETPFDLTNKGRQISKNTGLVKTKYGRSDKRVELHLRFKANQTLESTQKELKRKIKQKNTDTNNFRMLSEKADLLKGLVNQPHTNKPLKLVRTGDKKTTVARGGDKAMRQLILLFGIQEFKDKLDGMKQKYAFTDKTEKILGYPKTYSCRITDQKHPTVQDFKYFAFKSLEENIENIFLNYLYCKMKSLGALTVFDIGELKTYERIDIPPVKMFRLEYVVGSQVHFYMFSREGGNFRFSFKKIGSNSPNSSYSNSLKYSMHEKSPFVEYNEAVRLARKLIRSNPDTMLRDAGLARFYLRNEDKYRMDPIGNILKVIDLHKRPNNKGDSKYNILFANSVPTSRKRSESKSKRSALKSTASKSTASKSTASKSTSQKPWHFFRYR